MLFRSPGEVAGLDGVRLAGRGALLTDQYHLGAGRDVQARLDHAVIAQRDADPGLRAEQGATADAHPVGAAAGQGAHGGGATADVGPVDRKSTRLNSSHVAISYAVFCLKKKKFTRQVVG